MVKLVAKSEEMKITRYRYIQKGILKSCTNFDMYRDSRGACIQIALNRVCQWQSFYLSKHFEIVQVTVITVLYTMHNITTIR